MDIRNSFNFHKSVLVNCEIKLESKQRLEILLKYQKNVWRHLISKNSFVFKFQENLLTHVVNCLVTSVRFLVLLVYNNESRNLTDVT